MTDADSFLLEVLSQWVQAMEQMTHVNLIRCFTRIQEKLPGKIDTIYLSLYKDANVGASKHS